MNTKTFLVYKFELNSTMETRFEDALNKDAKFLDNVQSKALLKA